MPRARCVIKQKYTSKLLAAASSLPLMSISLTDQLCSLFRGWFPRLALRKRPTLPISFPGPRQHCSYFFLLAAAYSSIYIMREFVVPCLVFFLSVERADGLALFGRQRRSNNGTSPAPNRLNKRVQQQAVLATRFSTLFVGGDPAKTRTANGGFDCRVDILNGLWGFCPSTVIAATDCGLAGSCVDSFSCSKGCGFTDMPLTTFTWYVHIAGPNGPFP